MSDLVKRLRKLKSWDVTTSFFSYAETCDAAADRIEELEKEVQEWKAKYEWAADKLRRVAVEIDNAST